MLYRLMLVAAFTVAFAGAARAAADPPERALARGDVVQLTVVGEKDLTRTVTVSSKGTVSLGYYGEVRVAGLTAPAATEAIRAALRRYLRDPEVSVEFPETRFAVLGAVQKPGQFTTSGDQIPVLEALAQAGGPTDRANLRSATLVRQTADGPQRVRLDLHGAIKRGTKGELPMMQSGDILYVDRRGQPIATTLMTILGAAASLGWLLR